MRIYSLFFAGLLFPVTVYAQYQPIETYRPSQGTPAQSIPQETPVEQIPQNGAPSQQMVPEPDAPDESDVEVPKNMPLPVEPQEIPQPNPQANPAAAYSPSKTPQATQPSQPAAGDTDFSSVTVRGLNKVTARAETIDVPIGSAVRFGTIEIVAHRCWQSAPEERPENAALLEISEIKQGEPPAQIFLGWMFSSTPALSALEHPFYDITVIQCQKAQKEEVKAPEAPVTTKIKKAVKSSAP